MTNGPSCNDLKELAAARMLDAEVLLRPERYGAAFYLAGYAVECGLKAIIARSFQAGVIPDRAFVQKIYSHDLKALVTLADLGGELDAEKLRSAEFQANWAIVSGWSESARYAIIQPFIAELMVSAVSNEPDGVMSWLKKRW